jgi:hypothetical protein
LHTANSFFWRHPTHSSINNYVRSPFVHFAAFEIPLNNTRHCPSQCKHTTITYTSYYRHHILYMYNIHNYLYKKGNILFYLFFSNQKNYGHIINLLWFRYRLDKRIGVIGNKYCSVMTIFLYSPKSMIMLPNSVLYYVHNCCCLYYNFLFIWFNFFFFFFLKYNYLLFKYFVSLYIFENPHTSGF